MKKKYKILVTGVAGFIGSKVCKELQRNKYSIVGVDDLSSGKKKIFQKILLFLNLIYQIIKIIKNFQNVNIFFI